MSFAMPTGDPAAPVGVHIPDYVARFAQDHQIESFKKFIRRVDVRGKSVLEIGSDYHLTTARLFSANGAAQVTATNIGDWKSAEPLPPNVTFLVGDVCDAKLQSGAFDVIYGNAVLEHLPDIDRAAATVGRLLKPDGLVYLQGGPLWPGSLGHHLWVEERAGPEADAAEVVLAFSDPSKNPIPDWAHLTLGREGLVALLIERGVPPSRAERAADYVYDAQGLWTGSCSNFKAPSEIISAFARGFHVEDRRLWAGRTNKYFKAARKHYSEDDLRTLELELWMRPLGVEPIAAAAGPVTERRGFWARLVRRSRPKSGKLERKDWRSAIGAG